MKFYIRPLNRHTPDSESGHEALFSEPTADPHGVGEADAQQQQPVARQQQQQAVRGHPLHNEPFHRTISQNVLSDSELHIHNSATVISDLLT